MLSINLLLFPLLFLLPFLTSSTVLTLTLPSSLQALPCSSHATLTTHGHTLSAPVTRANTFVFTNLTTPNTYLLEVWSIAWEFDHGFVVLKSTTSASVSDFLELEVYKLKAGLGGRRIRVLPSPDSQQTDGKVIVPWAVKGPRNYYESRPSCNFPLSFLLHGIDC